MKLKNLLTLSLALLLLSACSYRHSSDGYTPRQVRIFKSEEQVDLKDCHRIKGLEINASKANQSSSLTNRMTTYNAALEHIKERAWDLKSDTVILGEEVWTHKPRDFFEPPQDVITLQANFYRCFALEGKMGGD